MAATAPLVPIQIETVLQSITIAMLGLPAPTPVTPPAQDPTYFQVRIGWQQRGQPFQNIDQDVTYILADEVDDQYNRVRDVHYEQTTDAEGDIILTKVTNYTRVWDVLFCTYGPNSFDNTRLLRTRLFDQDIHDMFANSQLYLVADPAAPVRAPEEKDGQWWERVDFRARFNEFVTETRAEGYAASVEIIVENEEGTKLIDTNPSQSGYGWGPLGGNPLGS